MADRTSAALFAKLFTMLAENPDDRSKAEATQLWLDASGYDFSWYQMYCDEALLKLGLAKMHPDANGVKRIVYRTGDATMWDVEG